MPKTKKQKDPNRPKRPLTAFMCYSGARRGQIRTEQPELSMIEISKMIGDEWKNLSLEKKQPYHDKAGVAHEAYRIAKEKYEKTKLKRPRTAYALFMKDNRSVVASEHPDVPPKDLMKFIAEKWKDIDATAKNKYISMAKQDRERWMRDKTTQQ